jgi:hypothetical protein
MTVWSTARGSHGERALAALRHVLPRSAEIEVQGDRGADLVIGGQPVEVKWVGDGSLGEVRRRLDAWPVRPDIVVGRRLSPGAREMLSKAGIGWVDETGAAEIAIGTIVVSRTGRPVLSTKPKGWSPAVVAVAEALLCGTKPTVSATAAATGLSTGACTNALRVLTDLGLLEASAHRGRGSARRVSDETQLLEAYRSAAEARHPSIDLQVGPSWRDVMAGLNKVGDRWERVGLDWAATGVVAANVIAPYLSNVTTADVYVDTDTPGGLEAAAATAGLKVVEGGRLTIRPFPTVTARRLAQTVDGLRVAPWPRVYVDLISIGVRGEEAAEHLREVVHAG